MLPKTTVFSFRGAILQQTTLFTLRASPRPFAIVSQQPFQSVMHPLHKRTRENFAARQTQLNIYMVVSVDVSKYATVRDRIRRRMNEATRLTLASHGYRPDGTPLPLPADKSSAPRLEKLLGTLCFYVTYSVVSVDWETLTKEVELGVKKFMVLKARERKKELKARGEELALLQQLQHQHQDPREPKRVRSDLSLRSMRLDENDERRAEEANARKKHEEAMAVSKEHRKRKNQERREGQSWRGGSRAANQSPSGWHNGRQQDHRKQRPQQQQRQQQQRPKRQDTGNFFAPHRGGVV
ncbi:hypothetical protein FN846DRAFT_890539 [Sphaerosporella brunnea]|uniref:Uncharacterized protein n=1 Tax=Sphaerosporella brunnea TaxID=1250544 RepID=A0A5J5EVK4_9PEZI|nr:hypothetical protein FN846DRAFT_890539 [Sphaerosporella brunnea]